MKDVPGKPKILILPRWYPNRYDPMPGLFIRRQAQSLVKNHEVAVLYVHPVPPDQPQKAAVSMEMQQDVLELHVYYQEPSAGIPIIGQCLKAVAFFRANNKGFKLLRRSFGKPDLIHVHVLTRLGVIALIFKFLYDLPYVVTEHWSRYFQGTGQFRGMFRKCLTKMAVRRAEALITVSAPLKEAMSAHGIVHPNTFIIPNQVDIAEFVPSESKEIHQVKRLIHVSCFDDRTKNISGLLRVISRLTKQRSDFHLTLVGEGPDPDTLKSHAKELQLSDNQVVFTGLLEGRQFINTLANADLLIQFSHHETFGTVVVESLACGVPVLSTRVGIAPEILEKYPEMLIDAGDEDTLLQKLNLFLDEKLSCDVRSLTRSVRERFSKETVAASLKELYQGILEKKRNRKSR
ncbi:MAG: glycosyltransferase family 4 protein [Bacteroidetes bacterium]|nr:glycosyltransferase family 4 protein [Bacteroidota bacterium]